MNDTSGFDFEAEWLEAESPDYPESSQSIERLTEPNRDSVADSHFTISRLVGISRWRKS